MLATLTKPIFAADLASAIAALGDLPPTRCKIFWADYADQSCPNLAAPWAVSVASLTDLGLDLINKELKTRYTKGSLRPEKYLAMAEQQASRLPCTPAQANSIVVSLRLQGREPSRGNITEVIKSSSLDCESTSQLQVAIADLLGRGEAAAFQGRFDAVDCLWLPLKWKLGDRRWFQPVPGVITSEFPDQLQMNFANLLCPEGPIVILGKDKKAKPAKTELVESQSILDAAVFQWVPLAKIQWRSPDGIAETQHRVDTAPELIADWARIMGEEQWDWQRSPLGLFQDGDQFWVGEGHSRCEAATQAGVAQVYAEVRPGGLPAAIEYSARHANAFNGQALTPRDKRRKVEMLLGIPRLAQLTNRALSAACHYVVSHTFVGKVRKDLESSGMIEATPERITKNGKTMDTRAIGTKKIEGGIADTPSKESVPDLSGLGDALLSEAGYDVNGLPPEPVAVELPNIQPPASGKLEKLNLGDKRTLEDLCDRYDASALLRGILEICPESERAGLRFLIQTRLG